jgi:NAD(P)-dependent dehydrogenase (short-subunit alcohol dehydrogenase family)
MDYTDLFSLEGKNVLIVGAAGGLAKEVCRGFGQFGAKMALADQDAAGLEMTCKELKREGVQAWSCPVDVSDMSSVTNLMNGIRQHLGRLDVMVNFAGVGWRTPIENITVDEFQKIININLTGSFLIAQQTLSLMVPQRSGKIILIGSVSGEVGRPYVAHYAASKGGIHSMVKTMAVEMAKVNVQINSVAPVFTYTPMTVTILSDPEVEKAIVSTIPMGRLGLPTDLVGTIIFLSSRASDFITGQVIFVDGGCVIS